MESASLICGTNGVSLALIMPVAGTVAFDVMEGHSLCPPWTPFVLEPHEDFQATLSADTHLLAIQLPTSPARCRADFTRHDHSGLTRLLSELLFTAPFFRNYRHALGQLERFSRQLNSFVDSGRLDASACPDRKLISDDRRICTAIRLLNQELDTDINIESVARRAGLSLRNLHYLMKQYIGQSPYQYVRGRRLTRVRAAIIRNYPDKTSIAQQALNWRFQHAGRFAAYYYNHFGEYPNETLRQLDRFDQLSGAVRSAITSEHYWLTSSGSADNVPPVMNDLEERV